MKPTVYFLSLIDDTPKRGYWDYGFLDELFQEFDQEEVEELPKGGDGIVVIPARSHIHLSREINQELKKMRGTILFLMGDEESTFPVEEILHPNIKIWVQNPRPGRHDHYRKIGCGYPQAIHTVNKEYVDKTMDGFFAGQISHSRREEWFDAITKIPKTFLYPTSSFASGLPHDKYYKLMKESKVVFCPSGPQTPDTFRLFEALELGCIPIADNETPKEEWQGFWSWLFEDDVPFPAISKMDALAGTVSALVADFPKTNNRVWAWWLNKKQQYKQNLNDDLESVGITSNKESTSVLIPISPIESHPQTSIIEETIRSIRFHFPTSPIYLMFDGVRPEQEELRNKYEEHIYRVLSLRLENVIPIIFEEHTHQASMTLQTLGRVKTPLTLFVEQDTPLVLDEPIEWDLIKNKILEKEAYFVRLHFEAHVLEEHRHLMIGEVENGFLKTIQWSQRPHLALTSAYGSLLRRFFTTDSRCFIEDLLHGRIQDDIFVEGVAGWEKWRLWIYHPNSTNIKRSYHTDGRRGAKKFDETQTW